jgi:hypothetical protein
MNCKPGDLAVIRPPTTRAADDVTGLLVTVVKLAAYYNDMGDTPDGRPARFRGYDPACPAWVVQTATARADVLINRWTGECYPSSFLIMWDHRLRPIRDPGEDARDETLEWLPVPSGDVITFTSGWDRGSDA